MSKLVWYNAYDKNHLVKENIQVVKDITNSENTIDKLEFHSAHLNQDLNYRKKANML